MRDRWREEVELLVNETEWTRNFFASRVEFWRGRETDGEIIGNAGLVCYAARQKQMYQHLHASC